uniref:RING-type E3 ubiquitin transferase n=1 Tax=Nephromyces sp. MMRI TaxID=2496275 RepID=A0A3S8V342_9APIC|nr:peroxisome biogenesis factor 10 [Nephromyces sp. MMRI]
MKSKKIIITLLTTSFITSNLLRLNMVIFFWKQKYFTLSHRITGIKYISTEANSRSPNPENFQFLIKLILLQILASILTSISQLRNIQEFTSCDDPIEIENCESITSKFPSIHDKLTQNTWLENYIQCLLCYSPCLDPSACPCGHIYCWSCITKWSFEHLSCPTCRSSCLPQELIKLR